MGDFIGSLAWRRALVAAAPLLAGCPGNQVTKSDAAPIVTSPSAKLPDARSEDTEGGAMGRGVEGQSIFLTEDVTIGAIFPKECVECAMAATDDHGRVLGLRLFGIKNETTPVRLGLMNGDIIRRINGLPMDRENALAALGPSPERGVLRTLDVMRQGREVTITYKLR